MFRSQVKNLWHQQNLEIAPFRKKSAKHVCSAKFRKWFITKSAKHICITKIGIYLNSIKLQLLNFNSTDSAFLQGREREINLDKKCREPIM